MHLPLPLLVRHPPRILPAQAPSDGAGLLRSEIEGEVLLLGVEEAQLVALVLVYDGKDASDGLAEIVAGGCGRGAGSVCVGSR